MTCLRVGSCLASPRAAGRTRRAGRRPAPRSRPSRPDAEPAVARHDRRPRHDEDLLVRVPHYASPARSRARAAANRSWSAGSSGPAPRLEQRDPLVDHGADVAQPAGDRRGVRGGDPRTHRRVAAREPRHRAQPPAASASAHAQSARGRRPSRHRLHERGRQDERQVADRRDVRVVRPRVERERVRAAGPRERLDPRDGLGVGAARDDDPRSLAEQRRIGRPEAGRLAARHRVATDEAHAERRRVVRRSRPWSTRYRSRRRPGRGTRRPGRRARRGARGTRSVARPARRDRRRPRHLPASLPRHRSRSRRAPPAVLRRAASRPSSSSRRRERRGARGRSTRRSARARGRRHA